MSSTKSSTERVDSALRELGKLRRGFQRGTWITAIVGFLLLAVLSGYFCYGYYQISILAKPDILVALVGSTLETQIPQIRESVETQVNENATVWAEQASLQVVAYVPTLREHIENAALAQTDDLIEKFTVMGEARFRRVIDENRETMKKGLEQLKENDELSDQVLELFEKAFEKELQVSMEEQSELLTEALVKVNERLTGLDFGEDLEPDEVIHRRILMIARRMMMEQFEPEKLEQLDKTRAARKTDAEHEAAEVESEEPEETEDAALMDEPAAVEKPKPEAPEANKPAADKPAKKEKALDGSSGDKKADEPAKADKADDDDDDDDDK